MKNKILTEEVVRAKMLAGVITHNQYKKIIKESSGFSIQETDNFESQGSDLPVEQIVDLLNSGTELIKEVWTPPHENSFVVMFENGHQQDVYYSDYFRVVCNRVGINHTDQS